VSTERISSFCQDGGCVGVTLVDGQVVVRNTNGGDSATFSLDEWTTFIAGVKAGEFDMGTSRFQVGDEVLWCWHGEGGTGRWFKARLVEHAPAGYPRGWSGDVTDRGTFYDSDDPGWDVPTGHNVYLDEPSMTLVDRPSKEDSRG
jgi:hypothetical protein